ncbi:hypothetical protein [Facilibium subflavum]|uniref:hypothetical protein n=1 Tax=Facilibium subflavum TaxID=2219058 RepID=UPI000E64C886|nr:hypothetical protein [Facilibium subflavum]
MWIRQAKINYIKKQEHRFVKAVISQAVTAYRNKNGLKKTNDRFEGILSIDEKGKIQFSKNLREGLNPEKLKLQDLNAIMTKLKETRGLTGSVNRSEKEFKKAVDIILDQNNGAASRWISVNGKLRMGDTISLKANYNALMPGGEDLLSAQASNSSSGGGEDLAFFNEENAQDREKAPEPIA